MHPRSTSYKFNQDSNLLGDHKVQCCIVNFSSLSLRSSIIAIGPCQRSQIFVLKKTCFSRPMRISTFWCEKSIIRSSINYAKDWLDQRVSHICMWSLGVSQQPFSCVLGQFRHDGDKQPTEQPLVFLEQACSWPVKRQSFAIFGHLATAQRTRLADKGWPCGKEDRSFWCCQGIFSPIPLMFCLAARKWLWIYNDLGFRKRFWSFSAQIIYGIDINNLLGWIIRSLEQEIRQTCLINARMFHEIRTRLDQTNLLVFSSNWVLVLK